MKSGGPDGELGASLRYLNQRYTMPYKEIKGTLTDIGVSVSVKHIMNELILDKLIFHLIIPILTFRAVMNFNWCRHAD